MVARLQKFLIADESGAVTVDWVVLTAAVIGLGMVVLLPIAYSADNVSEQIGGGIGERHVGYQQQN
jgi:hypothetical protein